MTIHHRLQLGGVGKPELLARLRAAGVALNAAACVLFDDHRFVPATAVSALDLVELSVAELGFCDGATMPQLFEAVRRAGWACCPLEAGPHLRLALMDQPEGHVGFPATQHRAPPNALTVLSEPLGDDDETPKGFYLRRIDGVLWLRGYRSDASHVWSPDDRLVVAR